MDFTYENHRTATIRGRSNYAGPRDYDQDGRTDIFVCNDQRWDFLFRNLGNGRFANVSDSSGDGLRVKMVARGIVFDDLDNDGRVDVVVLNRDRPPTILRNESATNNHWLQIQLRGVATNRDGVGAFVKVTAGDLEQVAEVHSGRGFQSHFGSRLHFGLGRHDRVDRIEVRWIGGGVDVLHDVPVDRLMTIVESGGEE